MGLFDFFIKGKNEHLDKGVEKTKQSFFTKISRAIPGKSTVDDEVLDNLEELLIASDVGVATTLKIIERIEARVKRDRVLNAQELHMILKEEISALLTESTRSVENFQEVHPGEPYVIMVVGVNGVGKTTTIGKLAHQFKSGGKKVVLGAVS